MLITVSKGITLNGSLKPIEGEAPMLQSLEIFQSAQSLARHSARQQAVVAKNIAHADTPDFKAMTLPDQKAQTQSLQLATPTRAPRQAHIVTTSSQGTLTPRVDRTAELSPNGNSVSIETEILKSIEAERSHKRAMTVYQSALTILRTSIGRGR